MSFVNADQFPGPGSYNICSSFGKYSSKSKYRKSEYNPSLENSVISANG